MPTASAVTAASGSDRSELAPSQHAATSGETSDGSKAWPESRVQRVVALIMATKAHALPTPPPAPLPAPRSTTTTPSSPSCPNSTPEIAAISSSGSSSEPTITAAADTDDDFGPNPSGLTRDAALLLDADLSVLGGDRTAYDTYAAGIRQEYGGLYDTLSYAAGRAAVLQRFLDRPRLYFTAWARARLEGPARANLAREIAALQEQAAAAGRGEGAGKGEA
ncbi:hypothetical protein HYH03_004861 [Edaphochlamys debaryana]|uniref:Uncharacterized protein n=1 Tax=Edaphochlamys debaryana TaxID=47281 RepID=A0A836C2X8_9CHLO|nr:hypothetical protein HYH03_004861 [Edaphochlamys debaryana]|eukprot:KAG2497277.1 hypothetical protein HYH03_004861 [Edaphochlamys debaryana]